MTKTVNSTTNVLINYRSLYSFINRYKEKVSIKEIDYYLYELKNYIMNNLDKCITNYLNSREIATHHQILLLNKFEALKNGIDNIEEIYQAKQLEFVSKGNTHEALT